VLQTEMQTLRIGGIYYIHEQKLSY